jgi:hypothetical protein
MGKGIVYCDGCGKLLREEDFARGKAHTADARSFCAACRPAPAPPRKTGRKISSASIPAPPSTRRVPPAAPPRSRAPIWVGGAIAAVLVVVLIVLLSSGGRPPAPAPKGVPEEAAVDRASEALRQLESTAATAADPEAVLLKCDEFHRAIAGTRHEARFRQIESAALEERAARERRKAGGFDAFMVQIRDLVGEDKACKRRSEVLDMLGAAQKMAGPRAGEVEKFRREYEEEFLATARRAVAEARADAERLARERKFDDAFARLDAVPPSFRATKEGADLAAARADLERRRERAARPRHEASHCNASDTLDALSDGKLPKDSNDHSIPRMTWWSQRGSVEWVSWNFDEPRKVSACEVYWFDDTGGGACRVPASWKLFYREGAGWKEVRGGSGFGTEHDRFNRAAFEPVETEALKIEARLRPDVSGGILEWRLEPR